MPDTRIYTVAEAAAILGVSYERVRQLLEQSEDGGLGIGHRRATPPMAGLAWELTEADVAALKARGIGEGKQGQQEAQR